MLTHKISWPEVMSAARRVGEALTKDALAVKRETPMLGIYGVPRGGLIPASLIYQLLCGWGVSCQMVENRACADIFVDDLIDSGKTRDRFAISYPDAKFVALFDKKEMGTDAWLSFPWERCEGDDKDEGPQDNVRRLIEYIGDDLTRDGLKDTPKRVVKSFGEIYGGYKIKLEDLITTFEQPCDEMVILTGVEFYSTCEHHLQPFYGTAHIGYLPNGKVIGISKLARILEMFSRRLQNQERICQQVTEALMVALQPLGAACVLEGRHFCMMCRGVNKQNSRMITSSMLGAFREKPEVRAEFLGLIGKS